MHLWGLVDIEFIRDVFYFTKSDKQRGLAC